MGQEQKADLLGKIPLDMQIREDSDAGAPIVAAHADSPQAAAYRELAGAVARRISVLASRRVDIPVVAEAQQ